MKWRYSTHLVASLGELWLAHGDLNRAQAFAEQCLETATCTQSRKYVVKGRRLKGEIALARREWDEAGHWLQQALSLARTVGNPTQLWKTQVAMGRFHAATRRPEHARQAYGAACEVIDHIQTNPQNPDLRTGLEQSPLIQQVYDVSASA